MCPIHGDEVTEEIKAFIKETRIGGVILYNWSNTITDLSKTRSFIQGLQKESFQTKGSPLFIAIDQEGGRVDRLKKGFPSADTIAKTKTPQETFLLGSAVAKELKLLGVNLNFSPVVDINSNQKNIVIGDRSFGKDQVTVVTYAKAFSKGLQSGGILPCLKHFPGHGDVEEDSHYTLPISYKTLDQLMNIELIPYMEIDSPFVMTAHILFPNIDPKHPATLSKIFLQEILRGQLKYQGLIITDSLRMKALSGESLEEICIQAFIAGNDILLIGGSRLVKDDPEFNLQQVKSVHKALTEAVQSGRIGIDRLNKSYERISEAKRNSIFCCKEN